MKSCFKNPYLLPLFHQSGATALHYAVQAGAMQTVKLLIKYKVDVNVADNVSSPFFNNFLFMWECDPS